MIFRIGLITAVLMMVFPIAGQAAEVTSLTAEQVARNFWNLHHDKNVAKQTTPMYRLDTDWDAFYIFAPAEGKGFVIVAADDRVRPVLAYSFHNNAMRGTMAPGMNWWLDGWQHQIDALRKERGGKRNEEWQQLLEGHSTPRSLMALAPMVTTQWDQEEPYNDSCPTRIEMGEDVRALTGCVATAMAQVMKYWNYPERGTGTHTYKSTSYFDIGYTFGYQTANFGATTYDWANMPDQLTVDSPDVEKAAVATLMYHCGVACDMYYGSALYGGSGAYILNNPYLRVGCTLNGMIKYFGYSSSATGICRIDYDDDTWTALVRGELDAARPVIYTGSDQSFGHCFVCDGYDDEDRYHFNWGWSGDGDGFFTLNNLSPTVGSEPFDFSLYQQMLLGIQPYIEDDSLCIIRHFPYAEDFETAPTCWEATSLSPRPSHSWLVVDSTGVDGNYSAGAFASMFDTNDDHLYSPAIVTPGDYKVNWQACVKNASRIDTYTLTAGEATYSDTVSSTEWQSRELLFSVAEGDTLRLDFFHFAETTCGGLLIDNIVIEQLAIDYTITVSADPTNGGTVAGGGTYQQGQSCTVTATANEDYKFTNWTENGVEVSIEPSYTFTVTDNRILVANFESTEGLGEQSANALVVYPNPVSDKLTVEVQEAIGTIEICDLMGAVVYSQKNCGNKVEINIADWQSGIYFLRYVSSDNVAIRRFIKR